MTITFIGHGSISIPPDIKSRLYNEIENLIHSNENVIFFCGGYGDFDNLCAKICSQLKTKHKNIEVVFVSPYLNFTKTTVVQSYYDTTVYPPIENAPLKFAISKRNEWMIENSDLIISYVTRSYGGAYSSLQFAKKRKKSIIDIANP